MRYTEFVAGLGLELTPGQRVFARVAFDGVDLPDLPAADRPIAEQLFGGIFPVPAAARRVVVLCKGARIGGTLMCALRACHLALTVGIDGLAHGERGSVIFLGPDLRIVRQPFRYALGHFRSDAALSGFVSGVTEDSFLITRGDREIAFECLPAARGGAAIRGRSLPCGVITECSFLRDADAAVSDEENYRALLPRIMSGGQLLIESTPYAETGLLHELFTANFGAPVAALAVHAPTLLMRPDELTRRLVAGERIRDEENCRREFDAEFLSAGSSLFFDPAALDAAFRKDLSQ